MRQRFSMGALLRPAVVSLALLFFATAAVTGLQAQNCDAWKTVIGWQGSYFLTANGSFTFHTIDLYTINETTGATVNMPTMVDSLCDQLRWQGADVGNTGSANDSTQVLNGCTQGQYFLYDTLIGDSGFPSNSEIVVDATGGTFSFQPIPHISANHTIYSCDGGQQSQQIGWGTAPATNWPIFFTLPGTVGPLTVTNYGFSAENQYALYEDVNWTMTFNLTPVFADSKTLTVAPQGNGSVASTDGYIHCPGVCSHAYPNHTQVTLNATPNGGWTFTGWNGGCNGTGACTVTMSQSLSIDAIFAQALQFVPVTPCRLVDTRPDHGGSGPIAGGTFQTFSIQQLGGCNISMSAAAYSLNVSVVPQGQLGYLTIWPNGEQRPVVATLNSLDGRIKADAAIVPAGIGGAVNIYVTNTTNVILDINGYFEPVSGSTLAFFPLPPCRVADTRNSSFPQGLGPPFLNGHAERQFPILSATSCNIPTSAQAYSLNFSVVPHGPLGFLTVWPTGQTQPLVSTLNDLPGTIIANAAIVPAGSSGDVSVYPSSDTDLVVDINGYFAAAGPGGLSLYPAPPCRVVDTRQLGPPFSGNLAPPVNVVNSQCETPVAAQAYVFNATAVPSGPLGYLTLWPDGGSRPTVSTLNALDGSITNNMAIVPSTNGKVDAYASGLTQLILDISSYFAP